MYKRQLLGRPWNEATARAAGAVLRTEGTPITDARASADYRREMLGQALPRWYAEWGETGGMGPNGQKVEVAS